jgi:chromosome segregation ATPase
MRWEEAQTTEEVSQLRQQLAQLQKQAKTQERQYARKHTRLMENFRYVHQKRKEIQRERDHLAEKLAGAEADVERMFERLAVFTAENPELAEENARRYANVRQEARRRRLEEMRDELDDITAGLTGRTHTSPVSVRELQIRFHPDKWSNGQTAEEALTELMKVLNR